MTLRTELKRRVVRCLCLALVVFAISDGVSAQTGALDHSPTEIVKRYLSLDAKGVRLDAAGFDTLLPYINWKDEPVWGRVVVIESFTVPEDIKQWEVVNKLEVVIPVEFQVLGSVYLTTGSFRPEPITEQVRVRVKAVKNRWRIVEPVLPPHVGPKRLINYVRHSMLQEADPERRAVLASLQEELRRVK